MQRLILSKCSSTMISGTTFEYASIEAYFTWNPVHSANYNAKSMFIHGDLG